MTSVIKLGIVGTGGMARGHAGSFGKMRGVRIVAACDVVPERVKAFAEQFGIAETYTDVDRMLAEADLDAIRNVTTDRFHAPISLKAVAKGPHVFCEKPLATCYADAKRMADAARRKGVINMVNFSYRNSSDAGRVRRVREEAIHRGRITGRGEGFRDFRSAGN